MDDEIQTTDLSTETVETDVPDYSVNMQNKSPEGMENRDLVTIHAPLVPKDYTTSPSDVHLENEKVNSSVIELNKAPGIESGNVEECSAHFSSGRETENSEEEQMQNTCSELDISHIHETTCYTEEALTAVHTGKTCDSDGDTYLSTEEANGVEMAGSRRSSVTNETTMTEDPVEFDTYRMASNDDQNERGRIMAAYEVSMNATYQTCLPTVNIETESEILPLDNQSNKNEYFTTKTESALVFDLETDDVEKTCSVCKETFDDDNKLIEHMAAHALEGIHCCTYCNQQFIGLHRLEDHMHLHNDQSSLICENCNERFLSEFELRYHNRVHCALTKPLWNSSRKVQKIKTNTKAGAKKIARKTKMPSKTYKKKTRRVRFDHNANARRNKSTRISVSTKAVNRTKSWKIKNLKSVDKTRKNDTGAEVDNQSKNEKPKQTYACEFCGKLFPRPSRLKSHLITHTGNKPHRCEICGKSYVRKIALTEHMTLHTGIYPYFCDICNKGFATKDTFKYHEWEHDGIRPFSCETCGKSFIRRSHLNEHMQTHSTEKAYECSICLKRFAIKKSLKKHQIVHSEEKCHLCTTCGNQYKSIEGLKRHEKTHNTDKIKNCTAVEYPYNEISQSTTDVGVPSRRTPRAPDKAELCERCGKEVKKLMRHQQTCKGMKKFQCHRCDEEFFNSTLFHAHRMVHDVELTEQCEYCGKYFKSTYSLKRHMRVHKSIEADS